MSERREVVLWPRHNSDSTFLSFPIRVAFSPDSRYLLTGAQDTRIWLMPTGKLLTILDAGNGVEAACFSPDGNRLAQTSGHGTLSIWSRRRPEYWWGIAWLPEFWVALLSGGALLVIAVRRLRARKTVKQEVA